MNFLFYIFGCLTGIVIMCLLQINRGDEKWKYKNIFYYKIKK